MRRYSLWLPPTHGWSAAHRVKGRSIFRHAAGCRCTLSRRIGSRFSITPAAAMRRRGTRTPLADSPLAELLLTQPAENIKLPLRQVVEVEIENTMTSCGYGVPIMSFEQDRTITNRGRKFKESRSLNK